jgi:hypothetical protein
MSTSPASRQENLREKEKSKRVTLHLLEEGLRFLFLIACFFRTDLDFFGFFFISVAGRPLSVATEQQNDAPSSPPPL